MEVSILDTIKQMLGLSIEDSSFDTEVILHINTVLFTLCQLGVGSPSSLRITGSNETWDMLLGDRTDLEAAKDYISTKVRLAFDPPSSSSVMEVLKQTADELEWRLREQVESKNGV